MDPRKFVSLLTGRSGTGATPPKELTDPPQATVVSEGCPFCAGVVAFDLGLDINVCLGCGAHETTRGWQKR
jgi:hypothetical protein